MVFYYIIKKEALFSDLNFHTAVLSSATHLTESNDYQYWWLLLSFCIFEGERNMREKLLSDFITNQYNIRKFEDVTKAFLELIDTVVLILSDDSYNIKITPSYEMKISGYSSVRNTTSKVESFVIHKYDTEEKLKELLFKYSKSFNGMSKIERELFTRLFINREKKTNVMADMSLYQYQFDPIKKSAVVKFCLVLGLDKYIDVV